MKDKKDILYLVLDIIFIILLFILSKSIILNIICFIGIFAILIISIIKKPKTNIIYITMGISLISIILFIIFFIIGFMTITKICDKSIQATYKNAEFLLQKHTQMAILDNENLSNKRIITKTDLYDYIIDEKIFTDECELYVINENNNLKPYISCGEIYETDNFNDKYIE